MDNRAAAAVLTAVSKLELDQHQKGAAKTAGLIPH